MKSVVGICFSLLMLFSKAQISIPFNYFTSPIDSAISLAGNFGELRPNHFHAGLDIKTNNSEGMIIRAVADGYVSRIKVSTHGYGKCLYITHPNGYVSVYAHLSKFLGEINPYLKNEQYKIQSFELDIYPEKNRLLVKKGDAIALSGNSGGSSGPHLHFEIREEKSEAAINPQLLGLKIKDEQAPKLQSIYIYPIDSFSSVNNRNSPTIKKISSIANKNISDTILATGKIGLGVECFDSESNSSNKNGVYSINIKVNNKNIYTYKLDRIPFEESRYINCHSDFKTQIEDKKWVHRCFLLSNNKLSIYDSIIDKGIIQIEKNKIYHIEITLKDIAGNAAIHTLTIKGTDRNQTLKPIYQKFNRTYYATFLYNQPNEFKTNDLIINLPENTLYENLRFYYSQKQDSNKKYLSLIHEIFDETIPAHTNYTLSIKTIGLTEQLKQKACISSITTRTGKRYEGGVFNGEWITTQPKIFGKFTVTVDTTPPTLRPINIKNEKSMKNINYIKIKIDDDFSGIKSYVGKIDNEWILMEYDYKTNLLIYEFDNKIKTGPHVFSLVVTDHLLNETTYKAKFYR